MAHWFHRNPLKATAPQDFNLKMVSHDVEAIKVRLSIFCQFPITQSELTPFSMNSKNCLQGYPLRVTTLAIAKNVTISGVSVYPAIFIIRCRLNLRDKTVTAVILSVIVTQTGVAVSVIQALYGRYQTHCLCYGAMGHHSLTEKTIYVRARGSNVPLKE